MSVVLSEGEKGDFWRLLQLMDEPAGCKEIPCLRWILLYQEEPSFLECLALILTLPFQLWYQHFPKDFFYILTKRKYKFLIIQPEKIKE